MHRRTWLAPLGALALLAASGCSSAPAKGRGDELKFYPLRQVIPETLRIRRPAGPGADPLAGPGGVDYVSRPLPNAQLDCELPRALFKELRLGVVRACLLSLDTSQEVRYTLERGPVPFLQLDEPEKTPCLQAELPRIPVPREIFYQSMDGGGLGCYSSRLDIEANEWLGVRLPTHTLTVKIDFPLRQPPETDEQTSDLLFSWAVAPFWHPETRTLPGVVVPDRLCRTCLGEKKMLLPTDPPPSYWP